MRAFAVIVIGKGEQVEQFIYTFKDGRKWLSGFFALPRTLMHPTFWYEKNDPLAEPLRNIINEPQNLEQFSKLALQSCWWLPEGE